MKAKPPASQAIPIDDVHIDPANARLHPERNKATIRASLARFGPGRSIVLDGNNVVRAGNGTLEQAREAGFEEVLIVEPKPGQLVAVKRADWSATEAAAYAIADNRATDQGAWDNPALAEIISALQAEEFPMATIGFTLDDVDKLHHLLGSGLSGAPLDLDGDDPSDPSLDLDLEGSLPLSHVRMVQLFLTQATYPEFERKVSDLGMVYGTANTTDTVLECVNRAHRSDVSDAGS